MDHDEVYAVVDISRSEVSHHDDTGDRSASFLGSSRSPARSAWFTKCHHRGANLGVTADARSDLY